MSKDQKPAETDEKSKENSNNNSTEFKYEDVVDVEYELRKREEMIRLALEPLDDTWTLHKTKDPNMEISYKKLENSDLYTARGRYTQFNTKNAKNPNNNEIANGTIEDYYIASETGYNDRYFGDKSRWAKDQRELKIIKTLDFDHHIEYGANTSDFSFIVDDRDFVSMVTRFKYENYEFKSNNNETVIYPKIVGHLVYGIDESHPFYVKEIKKYTRGFLGLTGNVLFTDLKDSDSYEKETVFNVCHIISVDPKGYIPSWVVNQGAPARALYSLEKFMNEWYQMPEDVRIRKKNGFKKDFIPLFNEPHPKLVFKNSDNNDGKSDSKKMNDKNEKNDIKSNTNVVNEDSKDKN